MAKIRWTDETYQWLQDIHDYISADSPSVSKNVIAGIYEKARKLQRFPQMGYFYRSEPEGEIRILLYGHYRITYLLKTNDEIDILGVFHGALDIDRYLP